MSHAVVADSQGLTMRPLDVGAELWDVWRAWRFWPLSHLMTCFLMVISACWWKMSSGVLAGTPPLFGWMCLAYTSLAISIILILEGFIKTLKEIRLLKYKRRRTDRARLNDAMVLRDEQAMMVLQFVLILIGNTVVIVLMIREGITLKPPDYIMIRVATWSIGILLLLIIAGSVRNARVARDSWLGHRTRWLAYFTRTSPWTKCWSIIAFKAGAPQMLQARSVIRGAGPDPIGILLFFVQGVVRLLMAISDWRQRKDARGWAQLTGASCDAFTMATVGAATLIVGMVAYAAS